MLLLQAQKYLDVARKRGQEGKNLEKVYRMICCEEMYLLAYDKLYANEGALTQRAQSVNFIPPLFGFEHPKKLAVVFGIMLVR